MRYRTRQAISRIVRWCDHQKVHFGKHVEPATCEACRAGCDDCGKRPGWTHTPRKRRMLVCSVTDCEQAYFTQEDFDAHECGDAY